MKRRRFLRGLGGITVGLPVLSHMMSAAEAKAAGDPSGPRRAIIMAYPMGTHPPLYRPTATGSSFDFGPITASMEPFKDRTLAITNCPNAVLDVGGDGYVWGHPGKQEVVFTGTLMRNAFGGDGANHVDNVIPSTPTEFSRTANGPSVEHVIGEFLRDGSHMLHSVDIGVPGRGPQQDVASALFYEAPENPVSLLGHPGHAFATLFNGVTPGGEIDEAFMTLQRRRKSVLDAVRESFVDLRQGLGPADRAVLDDHADKIRQIELDLAPPMSCTIPDAPPLDDGAYEGWSMGDFADLQIRLMAHAMACGVAPVGRIEFFDQQNPFFGIPAVDGPVATVQDWHHPVVHASDGWAKDSEPRVRGFTFFVEKFAQLCAELDAIVEDADGRTALDNSLLVLGSDFGDGDGHSSRDLCFLVAGNSGPGRRQYHFDAGGENVNRVLTTLLQMACVTDAGGAPIQQFGLGGFSSGAISELLV